MKKLNRDLNIMSSSFQSKSKKIQKKNRKALGSLTKKMGLIHLGQYN